MVSMITFGNFFIFSVSLAPLILMALQELLVSGYEIKQHQHDEGGDRAGPPYRP